MLLARSRLGSIVPMPFLPNGSLVLTFPFCPSVAIPLLAVIIDLVTVWGEGKLKRSGLKAASAMYSWLSTRLRLTQKRRGVTLVLTHAASRKPKSKFQRAGNCSCSTTRMWDSLVGKPRKSLERRSARWLSSLNLRHALVQTVQPAWYAYAN